MTNNALPLDINQFLTTHLIDVFETMLSLQVEPLPEAPVPHFAERVTGSVGFAGEAVTGAVYLHLSSEFARRVAATMLGLLPGEISGDAEINDVVGECTNMLAGGFKSSLCDAGSPCAMSTPAIIRGRSFEIAAMPEVQREVIVFACGNDRVIVEIHIKFN
jgi:chemotaxis protein CheX